MGQYNKVITLVWINTVYNEEAKMMEQAIRREKMVQAKPILKWAGGKTQMLGDLTPKVPKTYGRYIEPFLGGGALFFHLNPTNAILADSNPELINMYQEVADHVDWVIEYLRQYKNTKEEYYAVRALDWTKLSKAEAAARMIYLNKTCYNGLYRVNRKGQFNVPYGKYKSPNFCDEEALYAASEALQNKSIVCNDYHVVLKEYAQAGDFIFLDPPYLPISECSDFKRYTKEQFYEENHIELAKEVQRLQKIGCHVILTNSNHPLVHQLYAPYNIEVIQTKRYISCNGDKRKGEDVIVTILTKKEEESKIVLKSLEEQVQKYPPTRFMGSKSKLLGQIWSVASQFEFDTVVDLFSGSGIVGYMFKAQGKAVISNDYMAMSAIFTKAMVENSHTILPLEEAKALLLPTSASDHFVSKTFQDLYYSDAENEQIDNMRANIAAIKDPYQHAIAMTALIRACIKKRPRGIFTYTGNRYDDGRKDLKKTLEEQFLEAVVAINEAVFDNKKVNKSNYGDAMELQVGTQDLIYIDPPYYSPLSDNEYVRRYHFVEGLARDWKGVEIQQNTQTKKFKSYPTPFSTRKGAAEAFDRLFAKFAKSILIISYSSNSQPTQEEMISLLKKHKEHVDVFPIDYTYAFGNQKAAKTNRNKVQEYLFVAY